MGFPTKPPGSKPSRKAAAARGAALPPLADRLVVLLGHSPAGLGGPPRPGVLLAAADPRMRFGLVSCEPRS